MDGSFSMTFGFTTFCLNNVFADQFPAKAVPGAAMTKNHSCASSLSMFMLIFLKKQFQMQTGGRNLPANYLVLTTRKAPIYGRLKDFYHFFVYVSLAFLLIIV
jgi:hypothetical protein